MYRFCLRFGFLCGLAAFLCGTQLHAQGLRERLAIAQDVLEQSQAQIDAGATQTDRAEAMVGAIRGFEDGLGELRSILRRLQLADEQLSRNLARNEVETAQLLAALIETERGGSFLSLLHPDGPIGTAHAGIMLADIAPAIQSEVTVLRQDLQRIGEVKKLHDAAQSTLETGLSALQRARVALSRAIADRAPLPKKFTSDPLQTAVLLAATASLEEFAQGLDILAIDEFDRPPAPPPAPGALVWPVRGRVLEEFGTPTQAGPLSGIRLATQAETLVLAPNAGTVRYVGTLLDYGLLIILEPSDGLLIVLAGLRDAFVDTGDIVKMGSPIGNMGGEFSQSILGEGAGVLYSETLYVEIRENDLIVDPMTWFKPQ